MLNLRFFQSRRLPLIRQAQAAECGLACVAMVASFHGYQTDLTTLRQKHPLSLKGANLRQIMEVASNLNLIPRALRLEVNDLPKLSRPAILHWDLNHFVVLKSVGTDRVKVHCPAKGVLNLTYEEFGKHFTGVALELSPGQDFERKKERADLSIWQLIPSVQGLVSLFFQIIAVSLVLQGLTLLAPYMMMIVTDEVVPSQDIDLLTVLGLGFLGVALVQTLVKVHRNWLQLYLGTNLNYSLSANLFRHMIYLPYAFFEKRHLGDVQSRFDSMDEVNKIVSAHVVEGLLDSVMIIVTVTLLLIYSPLLTAIIVGVTLLNLLIRLLLFPELRRRENTLIIDRARRDSNFLETVRGSQTIKVFRGEEDRENRWLSYQADMLTSDARVEKLRIGLDALDTFTFSVLNIVVIWVGAELIIEENALTIGMLMAIMMWKRNFEDAAKNFVEATVQTMLIGLHRDRISDIALQEQEQVTDKFDEQHEIEGHIQVDELGFRYAESEPFIFQNVNLEAPKGASTIIIGPSGCGKTTLLKVLVGLLRPSEGKVLVDGKDIDHWGLGVYRSSIGVVMQEDQLFSGSLRENITFFSPNPDDEWLQKCAELACLDQDIGMMPMGYETLIGDMGTVLSGGQKQRLLLARALYRKPAILFLDEATSHLDVDNEERVNSNLAQLGITRVMIAHRPETIQYADYVIRMGPGGTIESS